jgi:hypothetical protein
LPLSLVFGAALPLSSATYGAPAFPIFTDNSFNTPCCWLRPRSIHVAVENEVSRTEGRNMIIVDTGPQSPLSEILIANGPDIAAEKTIWINDDPEFNVATMDRYPGRRIWHLSWFNDGSPCLQLFQTVSAGIGTPLSGSFTSLPSDPERGWFPAPTEQCPQGLTRAPSLVSATR